MYKRLHAAAVMLDEAHHIQKDFGQAIPESLWTELCDSVDDLAAGEELPRNKRKTK